MKKKWMGFFVAAMLIVSQAMCVSARLSFGAVTSRVPTVSASSGSASRLMAQ